MFQCWDDAYICTTFIVTTTLRIFPSEGTCPSDWYGNRERVRRGNAVIQLVTLWVSFSIFVVTVCLSVFVTGLAKFHLLLPLNHFCLFLYLLLPNSSRTFIFNLFSSYYLYTCANVGVDVHMHCAGWLTDWMDGWIEESFLLFHFLFKLCQAFLQIF